MKLITMKLEDLKPAPYNPRIMPPAEYEKLKTSIQEFGYVDPLIINTTNNHVIGGNQRLEVLKELGFKKIKVIPLKIEDPNKEKALNIALNKISGDWDYQKLESVFNDLELEGFNVTLTGFDEIEIKEITTKLQDIKEVAEDDFNPDEEKIKTICQTGDLWQLGEHRLLCGDSTNPKNVEKLMNGHKADMVFTDPPYNIDYGKSKKHPNWKIREIKNDSMPRDKWIQFNTKIIKILKKYCKGDMYIWGASGPDGMIQRLLITEHRGHWSATIIWKKDQLVLSPSKYQRIYEPCFYGWFHKSSYTGDRTQLELWEYPRPKKSIEHPTMKPIPLCAQGIINSSQINDIILDLFGGSGSTLIACEQLKRKCRMIELDPHYCDTIIQRWEKFTGQKAQKMN